MMSFHIAVGGFIACYIFMVTAFAGWVIIGRVPAILHTPLMSGSNFVHGIVVVGGMFTLLGAKTSLEQAIGFVAVLLGAGNVAGGFAVTQRMLAMFKPSNGSAGGHGAAHKPKHAAVAKSASAHPKKSAAPKKS
jgi:NAD(P) transhydrogenase subunit alpha